MTKIWFLVPGSGSRASKCDKNMKIIWIKYENNVKLTNHIFSHLFHIIFILFSHFGARNPGPGPKAAAGQARPGPRAAALGPRPGSRAPKCENNMKRIWQSMKIMWFLNFTLFSHFIHIIFIFLSHFWARDPDPGPTSHIFVIFLVIFFHMIFIFLWKPSFPACPYGQSL